MLNHSVKLSMNQLNKMSSSQEEIDVIVEQTVEEIGEGLKKSKHKLSNAKAEDIFKEKNDKTKSKISGKHFAKMTKKSVKNWRHQF